MATKAEVQSFIDKIGAIASKVCRERGYGDAQVYTCISQAGLETGWGASQRMVTANAPFGIKATAGWIKTAKYGGLVYNSITKEVYNGLTTTINGTFRAYRSLEDAINDYFDLLNLDRYKDSLTKNTVKDAITVIKNGGYATSPSYIESIVAVYNSFGYMMEKWKVGTTPAPTPINPVIENTHPAQKLVDTVMAWVGLNEANGSHRAIIDFYNSYARIFGMTQFGYNAPWCAMCASCAAIGAKYTDIVPISASCNDMIAKFKVMDCWCEDESVIPKIGWYAFYDWGDEKDYATTNNTGSADHVGIVCRVYSDGFDVVEGNYDDAVKIRHLKFNGRYLRGFGVPKYTDQDNSSVQPAPPPIVDDNKEIEYKTGHTYTLQASMFVRISPAGEKKLLSQLTPDGKKHSYDDGTGHAVLNKGTRVTCLSITKVGQQQWMRIPSGYVCACSPKKVYIS